MKAIPMSCNTRFGSLTALEKVYNTTHNIWTFLCDCGIRKDLRVYDVVSGKVKSCGCYYLIHGRYKKYDNSAESTAAKIMTEYQQSALKRKYTWNLSASEFTTLIYAPCHYCGIEFSMTRNRWIKPDGTKLAEARRKGVREEWIEAATIQYNGIDRQDNSIGYSIENCVSCCRFCNTAKGTRSKREFLDCVKRVAEYNARY